MLPEPNMEPNDAGNTTAAVEQFVVRLAELKGDMPADEVVRALLSRAVGRLHLLCAKVLYHSYPRLTNSPLNLQAEELLSSVVERLLKAMQKVRPGSVRQVFALANQHMRWELNDLARRLDNQAPDVVLLESLAASPESSGSELSQSARKILDAIEGLPDDEREVFSLVRIQGMTQAEAAEITGVSTKTIQRRLNRSLLLLSQSLSDLKFAQPTADEKDAST